MQKRIKIKDTHFRVYLTESKINVAIRSLADTINKDYYGRNPLFIVVLNGGFMFASDLLKKLTIDCEVAFIKLSSYTGVEQSPLIREIMGLDTSVTGRDVIIVEDVIDSGNTIEHVLNSLRTHNANSIQICTLFFKKYKYNKSYPVKYVGKEIPDEFIIGFGLDCNGYGRNYPNVYQISR